MQAQNPSDPITIDFFGGEPLMQLPLIKRIIDATRSDPTISYGLPTNGLLLTRDTANYLIDNNVHISLSFDGLWQDRNRLQLTGKGTLTRILDKKELLRSIPGLSVHTMVARGCYNLLENYLFIKDQLGVNAKLTLVRDVGTWNAVSVDRLQQGITEFVDWYIEHPEEEMPQFLRFYLRHFVQHATSGFVKQYCGAGETVKMFSDNKLLPCTRFKDNPEAIGKIPAFKQMKECLTCEVRSYCEKGCLFEQIKNDGPIVELCSLYKYIYAEIRRMTAALQHTPQFLRTIAEDAQ
jgi:radical SAM protein with 4Fe4S-binding SPASM domain